MMKKLAVIISTIVSMICIVFIIGYFADEVDITKHQCASTIFILFTQVVNIVALFDSSKLD